MLRGGRALGRELRHVVVPLGVLKLLGRGGGGRAGEGDTHRAETTDPTGSPQLAPRPPRPLRIAQPRARRPQEASPSTRRCPSPQPQYLVVAPIQRPAPKSRLGEQVGEGEHRPAPAPPPLMVLPTPPAALPLGVPCATTHRARAVPGGGSAPLYSQQGGTRGLIVPLRHREVLRTVWDGYTTGPSVRPPSLLA